MANRIKLHGTTANSFDIGLNKQTFDASGLTSPRVWNLPNSNGTLGNVLTTDGSGGLSWAAPGAVTISGVIYGDQDLGLLSEVITARVDFGNAGDIPYSIMNLGVA